jgi:hypothetical protein
MLQTNTQIFRQICLQCGNELNLDREEIELQCDILDSKGLLIKPITFTQQKNSDRYGLFGPSGDPVAEAIMIGVLSNVIYDLFKMGIKDAHDWLSDTKNFDALVHRLGNIGKGGKDIAKRTWGYLRENVDRLVELFSKRKDDNSVCK